MMSRFLAIPIALLASAVTTVAAGAQTDAEPHPLPTGLVAPVRADPEVVPASISRLRSDIQEIVAASRSAGADLSILIASIDQGDTLFSLAPDLPLAPASNMKIYSTAAALHYLGPDYRYATTLLVDGEVREGVLHGDLVLRGSGDPSISDRMLGDGLAPFREMADRLVAMGVVRVTGDVVGDGGWFDREWLGEAWEEDDRMSWYAAPVGGLMFAESMVRVRVSPGSRIGEPPRLETLPATRGLALRNEASTVARGAARLRFEHGPDGIVVRGTIPRSGPPVERRMPVVDPSNYAAAAFRAAVEARGVTVEGRTRSGPGGSGPMRVVAEHVSPPLSELARVTNHVSHNLFAEALLKTVGRTVLGEGSFGAGGAAVSRLLGAGVRGGIEGVRVVDGSGLSRPNRASARATAILLDHVWRSEIAGPFVASLPVAGNASGLRRMYDSPAAGNLRAKTGTIRGVSALSGYVTSATGERLVFSIISNGHSASWRAKALEDRIATRLAAFAR